MMYQRNCDRCGLEMIASSMSRFNTDVLCAAGEDSCIAKERRHPRYQEAADAEVAAVKRGEYNFPGIGKPADL